MQRTNFYICIFEIVLLIIEFVLCLPYHIFNRFMPILFEIFRTDTRLFYLFIFQ